MPYSYRSSQGASYNGRPGQNRGRRGPSNNRNQRGGKSEFIDARRFVAAAIDVAPAEVYVPTHTFDDFDVEPLLKANLILKGYIMPSPIQDQAIQPALDGKDVLGIAGTGTGKTAAFALPILNRLMHDPQSAALIIAPTRELAQQIEVECRSLGKGSGLTGAILIGGSPMRPQLMDLSARPRIVIGTPGRIKDHLERGSLKLDNFNIAVLDEVDRMLDMGFVRDIRSILDQMQDNRQSLFFSATMNKEVRALIETFTHDPVAIKIHSAVASENVHQDVVHYDGHDDKLDKLKNLLSTDGVSKVIIFDETQRGVERLYKSLYDHGFPVDSMHGGKSQGQRQRALKKFKNNEITFLVATDVAARGIDVADISHVVNYSIPKVFDDYIHRIGRAGRAGKTGYAFTFVQGRPNR